MALALSCSLLASLMCLLGAGGSWRSRVHHVLPTPLMALGMGHAGLPSGLLTAVAAGGCLWVLGVVLARRARELGTTLLADAVDAFAMAAALVVGALATAASAGGVSGLPAPTPSGEHGHGEHAAGLSPIGAGEGPAWLVVTAVVLVVVVVATRVGTGRPASRSAATRDLPPALLMSVSLVAMLAG